MKTEQKLHYYLIYKYPIEGVAQYSFVLLGSLSPMPEELL